MIAMLPLPETLHRDSAANAAAAWFSTCIYRAFMQKVPATVYSSNRKGSFRLRLEKDAGAEESPNIVVEILPSSGTLI